MEKQKLLKNIYLDACEYYTMLGNKYINIMKREGYNILEVDTLAGEISSKEFNIENEPFETKPYGVSALINLQEGPDILKVWREAITDKKNQILIIYIPIIPSNIYIYNCAGRRYQTFFGVLNK